MSDTPADIDKMKNVRGLSENIADMSNFLEKFMIQERHPYKLLYRAKGGGMGGTLRHSEDEIVIPKQVQRVVDSAIRKAVQEQLDTALIMLKEV